MARWWFAIAILAFASGAIAQDMKLSTACAAYGASQLQAQCAHNEAMAASAARLDDARRDLATSVLRANAARENRACAAKLKSELARGRITSDELKRARKNHQDRADLSCRLLHDLTRG
jgi:hypothetical protein